MNTLVTNAADFDHLGSLLDDGLLLVDGESSEILRANPAAVRFLGENLIGFQANTVLTASNITQEVRSCFNGDRPMEFVTGVSHDRFRQFRVRLKLMPEGRVAVLLMDMTLQHNLEKVRRDFVANVSHELRSPLTSLVGFIETMQASRELDNATRQRFLSIMDEEARRMSRLIDDLMSLSRVETEEHIAPTDTIYIKSVVQSVIASMSNRAAMENQAILFKDNRADADDAAVILGETDEIMEVFHNLLDNALKYSAPDTDIRVHLFSHDPDHLRFDVINKGEGIPENHIARLTERFYRVDKGRSRKMGGTGLGLAIVKHIVNRHRGRLSIKSELKGETVFSVVLPLSAMS